MASHVCPGASEVRTHVMTISLGHHGCLTPDITGPPNGLTSIHVNRAAAAPVHVVVRHPSKVLLPLAFACCAPTPQPRRLLPRRLSPRRGGRVPLPMRQRVPPGHRCKTT